MAVPSPHMLYCKTMRFAGGYAMNYAIYSRKSVLSEKGDSIENQIGMCRDYLKLNCGLSNDDIITIYEDEDFSGKDLRRPQFQKLLHDVRKGIIHSIVCYRLDRISRSISDFAPLLEELNRLSVSFICIREKFDTGTPMGKAMIYIASVFAQLERETIAERVRDNMQMLSKSGRWLGGTAPTGFLPVKKEQILFDGRKKWVCGLSPQEKELETVREISRSFLVTGSIAAVSRYLDTLQRTSRSLRPFSREGIRDILKNPVYCRCDAASFRYFSSHQAEVCFSPKDLSFGILPYNRRSYRTAGTPRNPERDWILAKGQHPWVIAGEDWVKVQSLMGKKAPLYSLKGTPLSGRLFCAHCFGPMLPKRRSSRETYDYICRTKLRNTAVACPCSNLVGTLAEQAAARTLLKVFGDTSMDSGKLNSEELTQLFEIPERFLWDGTTLTVLL